MTPALIAVEITPGADGRCGECERITYEQVGTVCYRIVGHGQRVRGPSCLAAEARIATIKREARVEALREVLAESPHFHGVPKTVIERMIAEEEGR